MHESFTNEANVVSSHRGLGECAARGMHQSTALHASILIEVQAENLDMKLRNYTGERPLTDGEATAAEVWSFPLSSWAYYYKLRQMEWIIQMGFELRIYQNDELSGMYW